MSLKSIHTSRLILIPITLEITKSLIDGSTKEIEELGIECDKKWPTKDTMDILPLLYNSLEQSKIPTGFETWMIVTKNRNKIIGDIGFYGQPNEKGEVEIGYALIEHEIGKGFGFESLSAIMDWLNFQEGVKVIKANCLISNKPSARILEKADFIEVNRDNELIYWEFLK